MVQWLIETGHANMDLECVEGKTHVHYAAQHGHLKVLQLLLVDNTEFDVVNAETDKGETHLTLAAYYGHEQVYNVWTCR